MAAHQDERVGRGPADLAGRLHDTVVLKSMQAGDPDHAGAGATYPCGCSRPKPEIGNRYGVPPSQEGSRDIFKSERLYAKKRA
jgi:hypothetical protein